MCDGLRKLRLFGGAQVTRFRQWYEEAIAIGDLVRLLARLKASEFQVRQLSFELAGSAVDWNVDRGGPIWTSEDKKP